MKKIIVFMFLILFVPVMFVNAEEKKDHVYSISMNIFIEETGDAGIMERWEVEAGSKNKKWCKTFSNLENFKITNVSVLMDEQLSEEGNTENAKKPFSELNYIRGGAQLCFGYKDTERHVFLLQYDVEDYIVNTDDEQILYHVLGENITTDAFSAAVLTYYGMPDNLEIRRFGYEGSSYMDAGRIVASNYDGLTDSYVTILAKFPKNTFSTKKKSGMFDTYNDALTHADTNGYEYPDNIGSIFRFTAVDMFFVLLSLFVLVLIAELIVRRVTGKSILKQEKVEKIINKITPVFKKIFGKITPIVKKIFSKIVSALKMLFKKIKELISKFVKFVKSKIKNKKDNNI